MQPLSIPLHPKTCDGPLKVLVIGRISSEHQNIENITASYRFVEDYLRRVYDGPIEVKHLGERASGMLADRSTIREAEDLVATGLWDLVIAEDLSRIFRNPRHQYNFVQDAVDAETRVICIGDNLDTADENWEIMMGAATLRHGTAIPDIRRRVRRTATHAFHQGGMVLKVKYGYRKLTKAEAAEGSFGSHGLRIAKRPECTPVIRDMMDRVLRGEKYETIAEWLRSEQIDQPPYAQRWTARLVKSLLADPILSGTRQFRRTIFRPVYRTGRHKRLRNAEPEQKLFPELAHLSPAEHQELLRVMRQRDLGHPRRAGPQHPLFNRPRSRVLWPGQHLRCAICGGLFYAYGTSFKCENSHRRRAARCWNHVHVPRELARERILAWFVDTLAGLPDVQQCVADVVRQELEKLQRRSHKPLHAMQKELTQLELQASHLSEAIARGGRLDPLLTRLSEVTAALEILRAKVHVVSASPASTPAIGTEPATEQFADSILFLANRSVDFGDFLRTCLHILIQPVQALDTPFVRPRAVVTLDHHKLSPDGDGLLREPWCVALDLFDAPLHIRFATRCADVKRVHVDWSYEQLANHLHINRMTVKRALDYSRCMDQRGLHDPYYELQAAPDRASRWQKPMINHPGVRA